LLRAFVTDYVSAGDQCRYHRFSRRRAHVRAFTLLGFVDDCPDVAYRNFRARMGRAVTMNTLRNGGLLSHNNHDFLPPVYRSWAEWDRIPLPNLPDRSVEARFAIGASHRQSRCPIPASGTARQNRPRSATSRATDGSRPWPVPMDRTTAASSLRR